MAPCKYPDVRSEDAVAVYARLVALEAASSYMGDAGKVAAAVAASPGSTSATC